MSIPNLENCAILIMVKHITINLLIKQDQIQAPVLTQWRAGRDLNLSSSGGYFNDTRKTPFFLNLRIKTKMEE